MKKWDRHTKEFKARVLDRMKECGNIRALAAELHVSRQTLYLWKYEMEEEATKKRPKLPTSPEFLQLKKENLDLKVALADKTLEANFFRGALQRVEDRRRRRESSGEQGSTTTSPR